MGLRVFIVAEVRLHREGLALALDRSDGIEVVGTCQPAEIGARLLTLRPDIVLFDMLTSDGRRTARALGHLISSERPPIIALGVADDDAEIVACAEIGIAGLVHRDASLKELVATIEAAMAGELRCWPRAAAAIARRVAVLAAVAPTQARATGLTEREIKIGDLIDRGLSNKEIAEQLGIEVATVKNHIHNLLRKLQVRRRGEAAACLRRSGMIADTVQPMAMRR